MILARIPERSLPSQAKQNKRLKSNKLDEAALKKAFKKKEKAKRLINIAKMLANPRKGITVSQMKDLIHFAKTHS